MVAQSTWQLPPVHCAPHSMVCPAMVPAADQVPVVALPTKLVDHRTQSQSGVGAASRNDDLRALCERVGDRPRAKIDVRALNTVANRAERLAGVHVLESDALRDEVVEARHDVVARDHADLHSES